MRERLIELVKASLMKHIDKSCMLAENITDDLIANGVIVPPCNVGDTVYIVDGTTDKVVVGEIEKLEYNIHTEPMEWITVAGYYPFFGRLTTKDKADQLIGKTVFLTREEAEQALKEREGE